MMNMKRLILLAGIAMFLFMNSACVWEFIVPEIPGPIGDEYSFANDVIPIFNEGCNTTGCHNVGGIPPDLSAENAYNSLFDNSLIDTIAPEMSELYLWMIGEKGIPMPPISGPDPVYNAVVLAWITEGAKNN